MEKELIEYIAKNLVNDIDSVETNVRETSRALIVDLHVAQEDMGRVIGKNGRVANAMRTLLRASTQKKKRNIILEIE